MGSTFCHLTILDHNDFISILDRGESVSDYDAGSAFLGSIQRLLHNLEGEREEIVVYLNK